MTAGRSYLRPVPDYVVLRGLLDEEFRSSGEPSPVQVGQVWTVPGWPTLTRTVTAVLRLMRHHQLNGEGVADVRERVEEPHEQETDHG